MNENRRQILEMVATGKINASEAEQLLAALGNETAISSTDGVKTKPKYIRVTVDADHRRGKTPTKVNIRVPLQLLRSGVRLAALIPAQARVHVQSAMSKEGFAFDLSQVRPENLDEIVDQLQDLTIDVDDDNTKVRIFVE